VKSSKKSSPSPRRDAPRAKLATPARQRPKVSFKVEPALYKQLLEAAEANRMSVSAEAERRLEKSYGPNFDSQSDEAWGSYVIGAFNMGGQLAAGRDRPRKEWIKDPVICEQAAALAIQALLSWLPKPLCDLRDAAGNPIRVLGARITMSTNPADEGKLTFTTPEENKDEG
jgi:hypothetical protein